MLPPSRYSDPVFVSKNNYKKVLFFFISPLFLLLLLNIANVMLQGK